MKTWDAIVIGAGIIGLSLALELRKRGLPVLVVEKDKPGREASWAAGGMLADCPIEMPLALHDFAAASARIYPEFVGELEEASGLRIDLRAEGTLFFASEEHRSLAASYPLRLPLSELEADLHAPANAPVCLYLNERCVDPRGLLAAAETAAENCGVDFFLGETVEAVTISQGRACGVATTKNIFASSVVINCAGAWAGRVETRGGGERRPSLHYGFPTRPVKGQMLCVAMPRKEFVRHVVRTPDVYLIPRSDGRMVIGASSEEAAFDKQTVPETIERLRQSAIEMVPEFADAPILEAWTGLRPGTPDNLPIVGATSTPGYFVATGHFRDGILLAPVTALVMGQVITGERPGFDLTAFGAQRF